MFIFFVIAAYCLDLYRSRPSLLLSLVSVALVRFGETCFLVHPSHTRLARPLAASYSTARPLPPSSHHTLLRDSRILISAAPEPLERLQPTKPSDAASVALQLACLKAISIS